VLYAQEAHDQEVSALCFSGDGNHMVTGGADKAVKVWSYSHGESPSACHIPLVKHLSRSFIDTNIYINFIMFTSCNHMLLVFKAFLYTS